MRKGLTHKAITERNFPKNPKDRATYEAGIEEALVRGLHWCCMCKGFLPTDCFNRKGDGFQNVCRSCAIEYEHKHRKPRPNRIIPWKAPNPNRVYTPADPAKVKVRDAAKHALKMGRLTKVKCPVCGSHETQMHHSDYNKPLDVMWLCMKHHKAWHKVFRAEELRK